MSNPYSVSDISQLAKQQMKLYQSSTASIRNYFETSYKLTSNFQIKNSAIIANQIIKRNEAFRRSAISSYIKEVSGTTFSAANLKNTMKPLFKSGDFKLMATANSIKNKIEVNPVAAYSSFQKALNQGVTPNLKSLDKEVRNQIKQVEKEDKDAQTSGNSDRRIIDTEAAIKQLKNPEEVKETREKNSEFSIKYFELIFQIITLILFASGCITDDKTFTQISYLLELIDKAITLYYNQPN